MNNFPGCVGDLITVQYVPIVVVRCVCWMEKGTDKTPACKQVRARWPNVAGGPVLVS